MSRHRKVSRRSVSDPSPLEICPRLHPPILASCLPEAPIYLALPSLLEPALLSLPASKTQNSVIFLHRSFCFSLGTKVCFWKVKETSQCVFLNKRNHLPLSPPSAMQGTGRSFEIRGFLNTMDFLGRAAPCPPTHL